MKYLSDKIFVRYILDYGPTYVGYSVYAAQCGEGYYPQTPIFTGRVYNEGGTQTLYLNDIIKNYATGYRFFAPGYDGSPKTNLSSTNWRGAIFKYKFVVDTGATYETDWVLNYYRDANIVDGPMKKDNPNFEDETVSFAYNLLEERTKLLPRIPRITTMDTDFWFAFEVLPSLGAAYDSQSSGDPVFDVVSSAGGEAHMFDWDNYCWKLKVFQPEYLVSLTAGDSIIVRTHSDPEQPPQREILSIPVANVDACPADYYLMWVDRTGAYQCQPFNKRANYTENITSVMSTNALKEERPIEKQVLSQWQLHTDWMDDEAHKAHESILTSPYLYLYDSKLGRGWYVNCTDSGWTDRKFKDQKKMYYLTVNLKAIANQNIIY